MCQYQRRRCCTYSSWRGCDRTRPAHPKHNRQWPARCCAKCFHLAADSSPAWWPAAIRFHHCRAVRWVIWWRSWCFPDSLAVTPARARLSRRQIKPHWRDRLDASYRSTPSTGAWRSPTESLPSSRIRQLQRCIRVEESLRSQRGLVVGPCRESSSRRYPGTGVSPRRSDLLRDDSAAQNRDCPRKALNRRASTAPPPGSATAARSDAMAMTNRKSERRRRSL